jgi:hypothetical protein
VKPAEDEKMISEEVPPLG